MAIIQIAANAVKAKLINADNGVKQRVLDMLSYETEGYNAQTRKSWSGTSSFFSMKDGIFPAGFVSYVYSRLSREGHKVQLARVPLPEPLGDETPIIPGFSIDARYDYQMETVRLLESKGRMIAQIATGGGKSLVCRLAYKRINRMTLFLTTRGVLMHQMKDAFEDIGEKVGVIGDGIFKPRRGFNVAMVQTITAMLKGSSKKALILALLEKFEFVILEEAHEISGNSYYEILNLCKNAHYRLALTATPFMKENGEDNMRLRAAVGGIGIQVTEKMLIERGILAKPYFKFVSTEKPKHLMRRTPWQSAYRIGIVENDYRNRAIVFEAERAAKLGLKVMILIQHKAHGKKLHKMIDSVGLKCKFLFGEHSQEERKRALNQLRDGKIQVLIGSTIADVGVDVPAVGMIILAGGGKAEVALRQRIGRGLRAKKDAANIAFIVDFTDEHNKTLSSHFIQRRSIIESTPGFAENILRPGEDFDFTLLENY